MEQRCFGEAETRDLRRKAQVRDDFGEAKTLASRTAGRKTLESPAGRGGFNCTCKANAFVV
ncbi:MAG: hypothetical protein GX897_04530 [Clostridiales bacterium]|nr:hypothetical protein [Clostridiales bacterium]